MPITAPMNFGIPISFGLSLLVACASVNAEPEAANRVLDLNGKGTGFTVRLPVEA